MGPALRVDVFMLNQLNRRHQPMKVLFSTCAIAAALAASAYAQDSTVTSQTKVDVDDARAITATGCLVHAPGTKTFMLMGAVTGGGDELTSKTRIETDVDGNDTEVKTEARTEVERDDDRPVGTSGTAKIYELSPRDGVDLAAHAGKRVEISAVEVDAKNGDDDAEVEIKEETKVERDDAPDAKVESETKAELPRGANPRLMVVSVKQVAASCN
jgi:hypothetical protein